MTGVGATGTPGPSCTKMPKQILCSSETLVCHRPAELQPVSLRSLVRSHFAKRAVEPEDARAGSAQ